MTHNLNHILTKQVETAMAIEYLKKGRKAASLKREQESLSAAVEKILTDIEQHGEAAVRKYAKEFDQFDGGSFRLTETKIQQAIDSLTDHVLGVIKYAQNDITYCDIS